MIVPIRKVLITGAGGFIGCQMAAYAVSKKAEVTALIRRWESAARPAKFPLQFFRGDLMEPETLRQAMHGCDAVFHCAYERSADPSIHRRANLQGTINVLEAAKFCGVGKVVYLSCASVYGKVTGVSFVREETPLFFSGDRIQDTKIETDTAVLDFHKKTKLPVTILRPGVVYGPYGRWTMRTLARIQGQRPLPIRVENSTVCNAVSVDVLAEAMWRAAENPLSSGEIIHISSKPITWKEFMSAHAMVLESAMAAIDCPKKEKNFKRIIKRHLKNLSYPAIRALKLIDFFLPAAEDQLSISREELAALQTRFTLSTEKAETILGFKPQSDFENKMQSVAAWFRWSGVLG